MTEQNIVCVNSGRLHFKIILRPFHVNHVLTFKFKKLLKMVYFIVCVNSRTPWLHFQIQKLI